MDTVTHVPEVGDLAIDFTTESSYGEQFTLSHRVKDGDVLLYFYVVDFGKTCTDYIAMMDERKEDFERLGVSLVHINPDGMESHLAWVQKTGTTYEHLDDPGQKISKDYGAIVERAKNEALIGKTNREFFLIGKDMRIKFKWKAYWPLDTLPIDELLKAIS